MESSRAVADQSRPVGSTLLLKHDYFDALCVLTQASCNGSETKSSRIKKQIGLTRSYGGFGFLEVSRVSSRVSRQVLSVSIIIITLFFFLFFFIITLPTQTLSCKNVSFRFPQKHFHFSFNM